MGKNLKELISKRTELSYEASRVNSEVAELLAQPCYDVLGLYENENPFFMTRGMSSKEILPRLHKIVGVKNYDGVDSGLIDSLKVSDIDGALDYLLEEGKIKVHHHDWYSIDKTNLQSYDKIRGKENGKI